MARRRMTRPRGSFFRPAARAHPPLAQTLRQAGNIRFETDKLSTFASPRTLAKRAEVVRQRDVAARDGPVRCSTRMRASPHPCSCMCLRSSFLRAKKPAHRPVPLKHDQRWERRGNTSSPIQGFISDILSALSCTTHARNGGQTSIGLLQSREFENKSPAPDDRCGRR